MTRASAILAAAFCLCLPIAPRLLAAEFLELKVELQIDSWDYWFFNDSREDLSVASSILNAPLMAKCVIGTNRWMMDGPFYSNAQVTRWFDGTNINERSVITAPASDSERKRLAERTKLSVSWPPVGQESFRVAPSTDGNPGRPVRVEDVMDLQGRICWLALCSAPTLRTEGRKLYPPSDFWKQFISAPDGFSDTVVVFDDPLGLPRSIELFASTATNQVVFRYQVRSTTNVLGWNIPVEFYAAQYRPTEHGWQIHHTIKGRTSEYRSVAEMKHPALPVQSTQ